MRKSKRLSMIRTAAVASVAAGIVAGSVLPSTATVQGEAKPQAQTYVYVLTAFTPIPTQKSTVLTLEAGIVGLQPWFQFTPLQLRGDFCKSPNTCKPVNYVALPFGPQSNADGAKILMKAIAAVPGNDPIILMGHSQGAQVIYAALREWAANPATAPDPKRISWVSIGNPENKYGGAGVKPGGMYVNLPTDLQNSPYKGIEVIRQYDGWADAPDDKSNGNAVFNALVGQSKIHTDYSKVNLNDPRNVTFTPNKSDGTPGNVTYVYVPTDLAPMVTPGIFARAMDKMLRPGIEKAYKRPVKLPDPNAGKRIFPFASTRTTPATVPAAQASSPAPAAPVVAPVSSVADIPAVVVPSVKPAPAAAVRPVIDLSGVLEKQQPAVQVSAAAPGRVSDQTGRRPAPAAASDDNASSSSTDAAPARSRR